ncbi:MAG: hypothetical protein GYA29_03075 [Methanothrix sp.]|nr:hypothetical protein [Methanothrix sp.]
MHKTPSTIIPSVAIHLIPRASCAGAPHAARLASSGSSGRAQPCVAGDAQILLAEDFREMIK